MKRILKKSLIIAVLSVLALSAVLLCACNNDNNYRNPLNGEPETGTFYYLQTVYDNGWISKGDLKNIAYYQNVPLFDPDGSTMLKGFKPSPKNPETLSTDIELAIKNDYISQKYDDSTTIDGVQIVKYYGTYDGFVAVMINPGGFCSIREDIIDGITIKYSYLSDQILLWKQNLE